jgi:hypothetical protein
MPNLKSLAAALLALALAAPACGSSDCEKAYDMAKKCAKEDFKIEKDEFVLGCDAARSSPEHKAEFEAELACLKQDSCEKMEACRKARRAKERVKEVTEAIAAGKWKDAFDDCTLLEDDLADEAYRAECNKVFANVGKITGDDLSSVLFRCKSGEKIKKLAPDFDKACKTLATGQLAAAQKTALAARDAGNNDFKACLELKRAAELAGGDAVAAAEKLCAEITVAEDAKKAIEEARANLAGKKPSIPFRCEIIGDRLAKVGTEWAGKTLDELHKACFVELSALVIEENAKNAKYSCPFDIKKLLDAVGKHDLAAKHPELAAAMKKLPAKCQTK